MHDSKLHEQIGTEDIVKSQLAEKYLRYAHMSLSNPVPAGQLENIRSIFESCSKFLFDKSIINLENDELLALVYYLNVEAFPFDFYMIRKILQNTRKEIK